MAIESVPHSCQGMDGWLAEEDVPIGYDPKFREFYLDVPDTGSYIVFNYCPWCGARLPISLREEWFDRIFALGLDGPEDSRIPEDLRSDAWWAKEV